MVLILLTAAAIFIAGYHPGWEDDAVYLPAIKKLLAPGLYPWDSDFFRLQMQATIFDKLIAASARISHLPLGWVLFAWQFLGILLVLAACRQLARRCFDDPAAEWTAVSLIAALTTIPVAGTALCLIDQHLHPRLLATAAILWAIVAVLDRRRLWTGVLLLVALTIHPIMAAFGISLCLFLGIGMPAWLASPNAPQRVGGPSRHSAMAMAVLPMGWIFEPVSDAWRQAAETRTYYFLSRWEWYEWLGVVAPLILLWVFSRLVHSSLAGYLAQRLVWFAVFQTAVSLAMMLPARLERLRPLQPMRFLHLVYLIFFLLAGGLIGRYLLRNRAWRWLVLFVPLGLGMFYAQRQLLPASNHLELPGVAPRNEWVRAFAWVRQNTPPDSLFALDPYYMRQPGEDYHGFRALAERSSLADVVKDAAVATQVPRLAPRWLAEVNAVRGWKNFQAADFARLHREFKVNWMVAAAPAAPGLDCPYRSQSVVVCRVD